MAFHLAKLTKSDGSPVYINCDLVVAVYQFDRDTTLVQFAGDDDNYIRVRESVKTVADIIYDATLE